jgi:TctA family transporter
VVGTLVGLLPGLGPLATISLLLPLTYSIPIGGALIMLAGIYYGAQYGDSVSAITMKIPHASSIVACIDGYQLTLKGRTGLALFTAGVSSFIGGTVAIVVIAALAPALGEVALLFGPADYCALMMVGFVCVSFVTTGSLMNGLAMCLIGVLLGQVGTDVNSGMQRFTLGLPFLTDGIGLVSIALGCFGIAEITKNLMIVATNRRSTRIKRCNVDRVRRIISRRCWLRVNRRSSGSAGRRSVILVCGLRGRQG